MTEPYKPECLKNFEFGKLEANQSTIFDRLDKLEEKVSGVFPEIMERDKALHDILFELKEGILSTNSLIQSKDKDWDYIKEKVSDFEKKIHSAQKDLINVKSQLISKKSLVFFLSVVAGFAGILNYFIT